ncbi:MAG: hypothetical protein QF613_04495 [Candidatus Marinimicrobia bacterium]|jgi:hypothetical protein|nr:hypothetical protein [Candidatus Neomarinimicrobiota bacterium]MDP6593447.1 hypothetical protein [Candidatus Neomarinimicrobiota bacterium]MDP6836520.1 hypothetical protein [Candidatus Neomarinimicrobiota bacterium]MDP6966640.1 hypothetical protein [Candidatus Neomarinimicrobiota bacterium]|tara:strand:- start:559 stop:1245 length:687 start_codon:yes stop_codon:yes gene_type:complete
MNKFLVPLLVIAVIIPANRAYSIAGIGLYYNQDAVSVSGGTDGAFPVTLTRDGFDGTLSGGLFVYIDAIPFVDIEASFEAAANQYQFSFGNEFSELGPIDFGWARASQYYTLRRKLVGFSVPILGGVQLYAGGGYNKHSSSPLASLDMVEGLLGDLTSSFDSSVLEDNLLNYLEDNKIDASGLHIQTGLQMKILTFSGFLNYRITMAKDVVPDAKSFSSLWAGLAFGF